MLKKRDLPICVEIPNIKFDIEKIKLEIDKIKNNWTDIYEANPGITNLHEGSFVQNAYENLKEIPLMTLSEDQMKLANEYTVEDLGSSVRDRIRNKKAKGANLPPAANEMLWDVPTDVARDTYFMDILYNKFQSETCRARLHYLAPGKSLAPHIDYDPSYGVRVVCPIQGTEHTTNHFWVNGEEQTYNLPADGRVWFLNTGFKHSVVNNGTEPRIALLLTLKSQEDIECLALK
jgi:quercetin dioxygenase-like cupin family protein